MPFSNGRSQPELCQKVARQLKQLATTRDHLSGDNSSFFFFLQHKMDNIYANPSSLHSLCCLLIPPSPSLKPWAFRLCTEIGCASVLCRSVTVPLAHLLSVCFLLVFIFLVNRNCSSGEGGLSNCTSGEHVTPAPFKPRVLPGTERDEEKNNTQMNHIDLPWSILSAYYEKKIFLWILILL